MKAKYRVVRGRGLNATVEVVLEDGRGFKINTGIDHVDTPNKVSELVKSFAKDLFGVEVEPEE